VYMLLIALLLLLGNALAQIQTPTTQMLRLAEVAERHSKANRDSNAWNLGEPIDGKGALANVIQWMSGFGYGGIPSGITRELTANLMTPAEYDALMAGGPYAFKMLLDKDELTNGAIKFGLQRIYSNAIPVVKDCPRGALLFMRAGGPSQTPADGGLYVCSGVGSIVHYNGAVKTLRDEDNKFVLGMYAPTWYSHPIPPLRSWPSPGLLDPSTITGGNNNKNFFAMANPENTLPSNSASASTPGWAVALIVVGSLVVVALIVLVVQFSRLLSHM